VFDHSRALPDFNELATLEMFCRPADSFRIGSAEDGVRPFDFLVWSGQHKDTV